jgi:hypothetical protein
MKWIFYTALVLSAFAAFGDDDAYGRRLFGRGGNGRVCVGPGCNQERVIVRRNNVNVDVNRNRDNDNDRDEDNIAEDQLVDGFERRLELSALAGAGYIGTAAPPYIPPVATAPPTTTPPVVTPPAEDPRVAELQNQVTILQNNLKVIKETQQKPFWIKVEDPRGKYTTESQAVYPGQEVVLKLEPIDSPQTQAPTDGSAD